MGLFKTADKKFLEIGFIKLIEDEHFVRYAKYRSGYTQNLDLVYNNSGLHLIQSYDRNLTDKNNIGNVNVNITMYEAKLCIKKMKEKGWRIQKK